MNITEAKAALEALIFAAVEPLSPKEAARILGLDENTVRLLVSQLQEFYRGTERGILLQEVAGGFQFVTKPVFAAFVAQLGREERPQTLSPAALETLAIIAYQQPVSKAEIEEIRGVRVDGVLTTLLERGLIEEIGRKEAPGRPILYGTTPEFLRLFGLKDLSELPPLDEQLILHSPQE